MFVQGFRRTLLVASASAAVLATVTIARAQDANPPTGSGLDAGLDERLDASAPDGAPAAGDAEAPEGDASTPDGPDPEAFPDDQAWIYIDKSERRMVVNDGHGWREVFRVALGQNPEGDKIREGDGRTPEGEFYVCNRIIHNRFHRFLGVAYPGPDDAERARRHHMLQPIEYRAIMRAYRHHTIPPWDTPLGGNIGIHGYGRRRDRAAEHAAGRDWTDGCIAVTNEEIERIYDHIRLGTRLVIVP